MKKSSEERVLDMTCSCIEYVDNNSNSEKEKTYALLQAVCAIAARKKGQGDESAYTFLSEVFTECVGWSEELISDFSQEYEQIH